MAGYEDIIAPTLGPLALPVHRYTGLWVVKFHRGRTPVTQKDNEHEMKMKSLRADCEI